MMSAPTMKDMFNQYVAQVEVEVSSFCNRRCSFCSNSLADRRADHRRMDDALFSRIVTQLSSLGWRGVFGFHRYNEPLSDRDYILRRVAEVHHHLPAALLRIYTNGDYLTADYCEALYGAGLRSMIVSAYPPEGAGCTSALLHQLIETSAARIGLPYKIIDECDGDICAQVEFRDMQVTLQARDFVRGENGRGEILSYDRGGTVPVSTPYQRVSPCFRPFLELQVECDGTVMPCCNLRSDVPAHAGCAITRLTPETDLLEVWSSEAFTNWRRSMLDFSPKAPPCSGCRMHVLSDSDENRIAVEQLRQLYASR